jgi:hypothetical protein
MLDGWSEKVALSIGSVGPRNARTCRRRSRSAPPVADLSFFSAVDPGTGDFGQTGAGRGLGDFDGSGAQARRRDSRSGSPDSSRCLAPPGMPLHRGQAGARKLVDALRILRLPRTSCSTPTRAGRLTGAVAVAGAGFRGRGNRRGLRRGIGRDERRRRGRRISTHANPAKLDGSPQVAPVPTSEGARARALSKDGSRPQPRIVAAGWRHFHASEHHCLDLDSLHA